MTEDALILRMSVNEHEQLTGTTTQSAHVDAASRTCRDAVTHHSAPCHEKRRDQLADGGQQADLVLDGEFIATNDRDHGGQVTHIGRISRASHHHFQNRERVNGFGRNRSACRYGQ